MGDSTYILIVTFRARNRDAGALTNVKTIRICRTVAVSIGVIDGGAVECQTGRAIHREDLNGRVKDVDVVDLRSAQEVVSIKEFRLGLSAVRSFTIPPAAAIAVQNRPGSTRNGDIGSRNGNERAVPFFVPEARGSFEDDLKI